MTQAISQNRPGAIAKDAMYSLPEIKSRLGISDSGLREARRKSLPVSESDERLFRAYEEITAMKRTRGEPVRTVLEGRDIYPESPDRTLMCIAARLATQSLQDLGTVLIATRDGDFTLVARAFEEQFGFGIARNSRSLNAWLK